ncbi:hypothetical protein FOMPIDRAFT_1142501 [Fomitopsis schrenkii]|uniref:tRNA (guanine(37)-N1)-methyltransferase n=1 Tax=Fomitopsis schrenkii TaxID=2126942 RepID=S8FZB2_FOMSC|nr:hypothetical protein FOMPIDRAFT_1142501 [Fomitopsis schrenkii]
MKELDREAFKKTVPVLGAKVPKHLVDPVRSASEVRKAVLVVPRCSSVRPADDDEHRLLLLHAQSEDELPQVTKDYLREHSFPLQPYNIQLKYDYWTANDILQAVLPEELLDDYTSRYSVVGHIAHINLHTMHAECLPWKHIIGQVLLDKIHHIRTIVSKTDSINNVYRVFPMEILAGEPNTMVTQKQNDCTFTFDFSEVYWNTRLDFEHKRIIDLFKKEEVVADVFAGVGPFALPAAKKGCAVYANDLNPCSYKYLLANMANNKVADLVRPSCMDGREFIRVIFKENYDDPMPPMPPPRLSARQRAERDRKQRPASSPTRPTSVRPGSPRKLRAPSPAEDARPSPRRQRITQFVMNLPDTAMEFLDAFRGVLHPDNADGRGLSGIYDSQEKMPRIHCYAFTRLRDEELAAAELRKRAETALGGKLVGEVTWRWVRGVAPNKEMFCLSFQLPYDVAYASSI